MKNPLPPFLLKAVAVFALFTSAYQANAVIIASDSFSVTDTRLSGSSVSGTRTEIGDLTWNGGSQWQLFGEGADGYMGTKGSGSSGIGLAFNFGTYQALGDIATVSASIAYRRDSNTGRWFVLGFGSSSTVGNLPNAVYLRVNVYTSTWELLSADNTGVELPSGQITGVDFSKSTPITYSLTYDNGSHTVLDISINGTSVLSDYALATAPAEIQSIGFWGQLPFNTATGVVFDNFELSVIPEPATAALSLGGAAIVAAYGLMGQKKRGAESGSRARGEQRP